jgi:spermidine synthase
VRPLAIPERRFMFTAPVLLLLLLDAGLFVHTLIRSDHKATRMETILLSTLFLCSGMPALIYQVVWQRVLFSIYGVNSQSVAVVVSAFMLGLGMGSLLGGRLSSRFPRHGILLFAMAELGVALFGLASLRIFHAFAILTSGASLPAVVLYSLLLLIVPTTLMGATLPLLVGELVQISGSVGASVSRLYFVNTLGSAISCYLCATFLLRDFFQSGSVSLAACLNTLVGGAAYLFARSKKTAAPPASTAAIDHAPAAPELSAVSAMLLAGLVGFIALGYEIAWFRVYAIASADRAPAFALLLAIYLAGIAAGSYVFEDLTKGWSAQKLLWLISGLLLCSGAISVYLPPFVASLVNGEWSALLGHVATGQNAYLNSAPAFFLVAALLGSILPLLCRLSVPADDLAGRRVSLVYASNILGSVLGSLGIGFVLTEFLGLRQIAVALSTLSAAAGILLIVVSGKTKASKPPVWGFALSLLSLAAIPLAMPRYALLYERMVFPGKPLADGPFVHVVENRNGVIAVTPSDAVFGGGVYDGNFLINPANDTNLILRALALIAVQPRPHRVLVIGLASGSWAQVLAHHPELESMDIVEINPGYLQLIPRYPVVRSLLTNPKVHVYVDDGRRWLIAHPTQTYDLIVANTTYHWRDHSSTLLSAEFYRHIRSHLNPRGIYYFNSTESDQTMATALKVFPYGLRVINFLAVSDSPIQFDSALWLSVLRRYTIDGRPLFAPDSSTDQKVLDSYARWAESINAPPRFLSLENSDSLRARLGRLPAITDDNMGQEWEPNVEIPWRN